MFPALVKLRIKYTLHSGENNVPLKRYYDHFETEFLSKYSDLKVYNGVTIQDFNKLPKVSQDAIVISLEVTRRNMLLAQLMIPYFTDTTKRVSFLPTEIYYKIIQGCQNVKDSLALELHFITDILTIIGETNNHFILTHGDKSADLVNSNEITEIALIAKEDIIGIETYKKIG